MKKFWNPPTGRLSWYNNKGYFNCNDPECPFCEDPWLDWNTVEMYYGMWKE